MKYKVINLPEAKEQENFVQYLRLNNIPHFAIPNGGSRNKIEAANLKKQGVIAGVPDMMIPLPNKKYNGLFIEMKRKKGGVVSKYQKRWIEFLNNYGYLAVVCKGSEEAIDATKEYLGEISFLQKFKDYKSDFRNILRG